MNNINISKAVIKRLPRYYKLLKELENSGISRISSSELSKSLYFTASQIRQDLNCFGGFGQQGYGYNVSSLCLELEEILDINSNKKAILLGTGNMGTAILNHFDFSLSGFEMIAAFDIKITTPTINQIPVLNITKLSDFIKKHKPDIAVLTVPRDCAYDIAQKLKNLSIRGIWNFTDIYISIPNLIVQNVNLSDSLMTLSYNTKENNLEKNL